MIDVHLLITKRTECGLSQRQLAKHAGVNRETIRRLEQGADPSQIPLGVVSRIAETLRVSIGTLLQDASATPLSGPPVTDALDPAPLDHNAARLLRRICRGEEVRKNLSHAERTLILPNLVRRNLVCAGPSGLKIEATFMSWLAAEPDAGTSEAGIARDRGRLTVPPSSRTG